MKFLKPLIIIILVLVVIASAVYFLFLQTKSQEEKIAQLNEQIAFLKAETLPIRFKVISRQDDETTVLVKFYNLEEKEVAKQEFTLKGKLISFDFIVVKFDKGYIAFPSKIFSEEIKASEGVVLFDYYLKNNFPMTYYKKDASKEYNEGIIALFEKISSNDIEGFSDIFGSMVQNNSSTVNNNRDIDVWYKIVVHTAGGIEIIED